MAKTLPLMLFLLGIAVLGFCQEYRIEPINSDFSGSELAYTKTKNPVSIHLFVNEQEKNTPITNWEALLQELDQKASKKPDSLALLRHIFQKTHQRLLKNYKQHSTVAVLLSQGKYDCVSGSALLGLLLDRYGYTYEIVETDYHVFLEVLLNGKTVILESTLPVGGMITSTSAVNNYLAAYSSEGDLATRNISEGLAGTRINTSDNTIFRKVNLLELVGLQYYNEAIVHFNLQEYRKAIDLLTKAFAYYPSERIEGLKELSIELAYHSYGYDIRN
jgi:tetratricopeptide (TPR) repeat protein